MCPIGCTKECSVHIFPLSESTIPTAPIKTSSLLGDPRFYIIEEMGISQLRHPHPTARGHIPNGILDRSSADYEALRVEARRYKLCSSFTSSGIALLGYINSEALQLWFLYTRQSLEEKVLRYMCERSFSSDFLCRARDTQ